MKGKSKASKTRLFKDCLTPNPLSEEIGTQLELPLFAIAESVVTSNETTLSDKLLTCTDSTQIQKSSETLVAELTSNVRDCKPYWTDFCGGISSNLLLPVEIDSQGLDLNLYSTWSKKTVEKSWFSTLLYIAQTQSLHKIYSQSFTFSVAECTDSENIPKKSRKIYLSPTAEQKRKINYWFGVSRFVYNETIRYFQNGGKGGWKSIKTGIIQSLPDWCKDCPYQIKNIAVKDACQARSNAIEKYKDKGSVSKLRFRTKKDPKQSCYIPKTAISSSGIYHTILGELKFDENLPETLSDSRLVRHYGDFYLSIPVEMVQQTSESQGRVVALDPGIRTFLTFFSENSFGWLGDKANIRIQKLCFKLDKIVSKITLAKSKQKKRLKKAADRIRNKITCFVDELHKKCAKFLTDNFDVILLPTFETSQMSRKGKRRIRSKSVRQMLTLSHYKFKQFLKHKAKETGKVVLDVNEAYTSKTVSWTGEIIKNLGGAKTIKSPSTGQTMNRDLNGARGIFLRALVDTPWLRSNLSLNIC